MNTKIKFIKAGVIISTIVHSNNLQATDRMVCDEPLEINCNFCHYEEKILDAMDQQLFVVQAKRKVKKKPSHVTNNPECVLDVAMTYYHGDYGVPKNYKKAHFFFKHQIHCNGTEGRYFLGQTYLNGYGVEKNEKKAFEYFTKIAESTNYLSHEGNYQLGMIYYRNMLATPETAWLLREPSEECFKKALLKGKHMDSAYQIGILNTLSANGKDVDNWGKCRYLGISRAYFEIAAVLAQHPASYYQLGKIRGEIDGERVVYEHYRHTFKYFTDNLECVKYKTSYWCTDYLDFDKFSSFDFFKKSADLGSSEGASEVLGMYLNGKGTLNKDEVNKYVVAENLAKVMAFMTFCDETKFPKDLQRFIVSNLVTARLGTK